jgi:p-hydroxybenzoate 3-monooxygenase
MDVQVCIIGAGPAGLMLARLLHLNGISSMVLESRSRPYVETRVRAGLLEQGSVDLMAETGMDERLRRECMIHDGTEYIAGGKRYRVDMSDLVQRRIYIYGQQEVVKDMIAVNLAAGVPVVFEAEAREIGGIDAKKPFVKYLHNGVEQTVTCDYVAGCDGFHGIARHAIPESIRRDYVRDYPFGWLGILADAAPTLPELIYCQNEERGFALFTMRSPKISRCYLQVPPDEDENNWSDDRIWNELKLRLGEHEGVELSTGKITHKSVTPMRSFVSEPMRHGRLFIAGDAAHIVPPTGAKGMNLAISDVFVLSRAFVEFYKSGASERFDRYTDTCLRRVWGAQHFSWWMTSMMHNLPGESVFDRKRQLAELRTVLSSRAGKTLLAENYTGLPMEIGPEG